MENETNKNVVLESKMDSYYYGNENLIAPQEITVTITLFEYRELVRSKATKEYEINLKNEKIMKLESELKAMTEHINCLKSMPRYINYHNDETEGENNE